MKLKIKNVETHTGVSLDGKVTTNVDAKRYGCEIDYAVGPKGDTIGFVVSHKKKIVGIPMGHVKQWVMSSDGQDAPVTSPKAN